MLYLGNGTIERSEFEENFDMQEPSLALLAQGLFMEFDADKSGHINMADLLNLYGRIDLNSRLSHTTKSCFFPIPSKWEHKEIGNQCSVSWFMFECRQLRGVKVNLFFFGRVISQ